MNDDALKLNVAPPVPYSEQVKEQRAAQEGMSKTQVKEALAAGSLPIGQDKDGETLYAPKPEAMEDLEEIVEQGRLRQHNWVDRGLKLSCEGAGHPQHEVYKPMRKF